MQQNLELTRGLIYSEAVAAALAAHTGKGAGHEVLEAASRKAIADSKHLREVLAADPEVTRHLDPAELNRLFDPLGYTGAAGHFIDRAIKASKNDPEEGE
jgi:3-carboxy-cis,cis-muconate cycloisomerase